MRVELGEVTRERKPSGRVGNMLRGEIKDLAEDPNGDEGKRGHELYGERLNNVGSILASKLSQTRCAQTAADPTGLILIRYVVPGGEGDRRDPGLIDKGDITLREGSAHRKKLYLDAARASA
jgi:hypothetical protein